MTKTKRIFSFFVCFSILFLFLFLRFFKLPTSFEFFNDIGRDNLVMFNWYTSGKPPLLGPQTSVMPFNQSAVYFYMLYPAFLLMGMSLYNTIVTCAVLYISFFLLGIYVFRKSSLFLRVLFVVGYLIVIFPQAILQQRFVWNPSFLPLFVSIALFAYLQLLEKITWKRVAVLSIGMSLAVSLNYSAMLAVIPIMLVSIFQLKKKSVFVFLGFIAAMIMINLPTVFFEFRHGFLLTHQMFIRGTEQQKHLGVFGKAGDLLTMVAAVNSASREIILSIALFCTIFWGVLRKYKTDTKKLMTVFSMLIISVLLALVIPFDLQPHYIFGIATLLFFVIAFLPKLQMIVSILILSLFWLSPSILQQYVVPARRTVSQLNVCAAKVCAQEKEPMFVSMQGFYGFHNGQEYRFLFKKAGCSIKEIETETNVARRMAVVVDNSTYEHGKTAYNELTLFGASSIEREYTCDGNIQVVMLKKKTSDF